MGVHFCPQIGFLHGQMQVFDPNKHFALGRIDNKYKGPSSNNVTFIGREVSIVARIQHLKQFDSFAV
jgi:hypothetical protein